MSNLNSNIMEDDDEKVIDICNNLQDLDREYNKWLSRSFDNRKISDDKCIKKYGCTNTDLYNKIRVELLKQEKIPQNTEIDSLPVQEAGFTFTNKSIDHSYQSFESKVNKANSIMANDDNIVIINNIHDAYDPDYTKEDLYDLYQKYEMLPQNQKDFSNSYSLSIWGRTVPDMYRYVLSKFTRIDADEMVSDSDKILFSQNNIIQSISDDVLKQELAKIDYSTKSLNRSLSESVYLENLVDKIQYIPQDSQINGSIVPFLTPDEYEDLNGEKIIDPYDYINIKDQKKYLHMVEDLQRQLKTNSDISSSILKLGWNPYVNINGESVKYAKEKQKSWFEHHTPKITNINLSNYKTNITEEDLRDDDPTVLPIYIVNLFNYVVGKETVDAAGFTLGSLKHVYMLTNDTTKESVDVLEMIHNNDMYISINCFYANKAIYQDIKDNFAEICTCHTDIGKSLIGKEVYYARIDELNIFANCFNSVVDKDEATRFYIIRDAKLYELYNGPLYDYIPGTASRKAKSLIYCTKKPMEQVQETEIADTIYSGLIENLFITSFNDKSNKLLTELRSIVYPKTCITINEIRAPFGLDDKGLYINFPKDLQKEYEEAHRLLMMYSANNLDGIKHELAHLYYINWVIEKKLKHTKKSTPKYKELIDLRARVLNDFKKYFKLVCEKDPKFDFMEYLKSTEYYTKYMELDYSTLTNIGKIINRYSQF